MLLLFFSSSSSTSASTFTSSFSTPVPTSPSILTYSFFAPQQSSLLTLAPAHPRTGEMKLHFLLLFLLPHLPRLACETSFLFFPPHIIHHLSGAFTCYQQSIATVLKLAAYMTESVRYSPVSILLHPVRPFRSPSTIHIRICQRHLPPCCLLQPQV